MYILEIERIYEYDSWKEFLDEGEIMPIFDGIRD